MYIFGKVSIAMYKRFDMIRDFEKTIKFARLKFRVWIYVQLTAFSESRWQQNRLTIEGPRKHI